VSAIVLVIIEEPRAGSAPSSGINLHRIYFLEPAKSTDGLENEKTCEPLKDRFFPDRKNQCTLMNARKKLQCVQR
jgi:hypothetical protein